MIAHTSEDRQQRDLDGTHTASMFRSGWHAAVVLSNLVALFPIRRSLRRRDFFTSLLLFISCGASMAFHYVYPNHAFFAGDIFAKPPVLLTIDRVAAALDVVRLVFLAPNAAECKRALAAAAWPIGVVGAAAGVASEVAGRRELYCVLHAVWHLCVFAVADVYMRVLFESSSLNRAVSSS